MSQIKLADGSLVSLDRSSSISVRLGKIREIRLLNGQARFQVAHDAARPFVVIAGRREVLATGTDFNVDRYGGRVTVSLISGRVMVSLGPKGQSWLGNVGEDFAAGTVAELRPGERVAGGASGGALVRSRVSAEESLAWQRGQISFSDATLAQVAATFNRYGDGRIVVDDAQVGRLRLSGTFAPDKPLAFAHAVEQLLPVRSEIRADGSILLAGK